MPNHAVTATSGVFTQTTNFLPEGRPNTVFRFRTADEAAYEIARFERWSENNTNGLTVTYRDYQL